MIATIASPPVSQPKIFSSEIFPLSISHPNVMCFQATPEVEREDGNRLSFHLSLALPNIVIIWDKGYFYALGTPNYPMKLLAEELEIVIEQVTEESLTDFKDQTWTFQPIQLTQPVPANVIAQLAFQVLKTTKPSPFSSRIALSANGVEVRRELKFWSETIELKGILKPAIALTLKSKFLLKKNLAEFYQSHPDKQDPEKLLTGLNVRSRSRDFIGNGTITEVVLEPSSERRKKLIELAKSEISKQALADSLSEKIIVGVKFGKAKKAYLYGMTALQPKVTNETASRFGIEWGKLLDKTKIPYEERKELLVSYKQEAEEALAHYGFEFTLSVNSNDYPEVFHLTDTRLEDTPLLFGNGFIGSSGKILQGLSQGGVYRRHSNYLDPSRPIRIAVLNLCNFESKKLETFLKPLRQQLKRYKFESIIDTTSESIKNLSGAEARSKVEKIVYRLMETPPDIVLAFLPQSDRNADDQEGGSLYHKIYDLLLRRQIASQMIYEDTLNNISSYKYKLNQIVPGILAKLGNLPFVLAEPLKIADYFIGLDISRESKQKLSGTVNACASIRLYGSQGEFIRYRLEDALIEGEEIPQTVLERLLPANELEGKTILIYRDGRFCGREIPNLLERAKAIGCKFILVECRKSNIPRLYNLEKRLVYENNKKKYTKVITSPDKGLALRLSPHEAILVTTEVSEKIGLAHPLRLTVITGNHPALISPPIEQVIETTLKLTLLHHGALKMPRLPMPVYGAHKTAKLRLRGIYPSSMLEGDRQFWL